MPKDYEVEPVEEVKQQQPEEKLDAITILRRASSGTIELIAPIHEGENDITTLEYDFSALTGKEYAEAMDSDINGSNVYRISDKQALALFAAAAGKKTKGLDQKDVFERLSAMDAVKAVQLAIVFINVCVREANRRTTKGL